jgi:hypothetical protein
MTETEAVARAFAPMLEGGREFDQMPPDRRTLKIWNRAGMCSCNDATQDDAREAAELAITALDKHRIERAREVEQNLIASTAQRTFGGDHCFASVALMQEAAATIASLRAEIERLTEREAPYATKADSDGDDGA